jgi:hypothetical protein
MTDTHCHNCGEAFPVLSPGHVGGVGYGEDRDGNRFCYACCAAQERFDMLKTGRATLYITHRAGWNIGDWAGHLKLRPIAVWKGKHNWRGPTGRAMEVTFAQFYGPDGFIWSGRNLGDNQILRARRTRKRWHKVACA